MSRIRVHSVRSIKRSSRLRAKAQVKNVPASRRLTQVQVGMPEVVEAAATFPVLANDNEDREIWVDGDNEEWR